MKKILFYLAVLIMQTGFGQQEDSIFSFLPEKFAAFPNVRDLTMSSMQDELYFTAQSHHGDLSAILKMKLNNEQWSEPEIASFSGKYTDLEPSLSPNGLKLYFVSKRPVHKDSSLQKDYDIWYVERTHLKEAWSQPKNLGAPINSTSNEYYPVTAANGNMYFTSDRSGTRGKDDLFFAVWNKDKYAEPENLGEIINTEGYEFNAFVASDESFMIFGGYQRDDGQGGGDLYISYKKENGEWGKPENMGKGINSRFLDYCPFVDASMEKLYFTSKRSYLETPEDGFENVENLTTVLNGTKNGQSRIYFSKISLLSGKK